MSRPRLVTVEPVLFGFMLCLFLSLPVQEQLVYKKLCQYTYNETVCNNIKEDENLAHAENFVQAQTSKWMLYFNMALTFPSMVAALIIGPCSDKIGRKFVIILPLIGNAIGAISMILNSYFSDWHVGYMLFGSVISGFFGNFAMILMAVFSYLSDITTEGNRTLRLTLLESMTFIGGCIGELIGGIMVDHVGYYITFCVVLGILILNLLYVVFFLNESYFPDEKIKFSEAVCSYKQLSSTVQVFTRKRPDKQRSKLFILLASFFFGLLVFTGSNTVKVLFALHRPLSFSSTMLGYFLAVSFLYRGIGVVCGAPVFTRYFHFSDYTMVMIGCFGTMLAYIGLALSTKTWMLFAVPLIDVFGGVTIPCIRSLMSKVAGKDEQGALFSATASIEVLCSLVASVLFNNIYSATVSWHPGFCFFMMSLVLTVPIFLTWYLKTMHSTLQYKELNAECPQITERYDEHHDDHDEK